MTGQIRASSVVSLRLRFGNLTAHTIQPYEFKLVLLPERGQKVVVGYPGQAERKICLAMNRLDQPILRSELAVLHVKLAELVGRPFR